MGHGMGEFCGWDISSWSCDDYGMLARWFLVCCYNSNSLFLVKTKEFKEVVAFFSKYYNIANSKTEA